MVQYITRIKRNVRGFALVARQVSTEPYGVVGSAFSAGGLSPYRERLTALAPFKGLFSWCSISPTASPVGCPRSRVGPLAFPAQWAVNEDRPKAGFNYVARHHLLVSRTDMLTLSSAHKVSHSRPAADPLFESMAQVL